MQEDLTGEIYYRFSRVVAAYDPQRGVPLCAYVSRMLSQSVFNYARDYWRGESRLVPAEDEQQLERLGGTAPAADGCVEQMFFEEVQAGLPAAIARLPRRQQLVLVWRYYDGRSFEEISEQLGVKRSTARSLLRHAIAGLRKIMQLPDNL